jgi:hypothetical protein
LTEIIRLRVGAGVHLKRLRGQHIELVGSQLSAARNLVSI